MAKLRKPSLHGRLVAYKKRSRAKDERALTSGKISAEGLFKRNFFFEGLDFSKARIVRSARRKRDDLSDRLRHSTVGAMLIS